MEKEAAGPGERQVKGGLGGSSQGLGWRGQTVGLQKVLGLGRSGLGEAWFCSVQTLLKQETEHG